MSSVINSNKNQIANQLKNNKHQMLQHEETIRAGIQQFYSRLREVVGECERQTIIALNREALNYHEKTAEIIKNFNKIKSNPSESDIQFANDTLGLKLQHQPAISLQKLQALLKQTCIIGTSNQANQIEIIPLLSDSSYLYSEAQSVQTAVLEKIQCERDYYQKREGQLTNKIRQMQNTLNRKGINIKQMSKSFLQQKCSRLALERLKGENKILVQKIGQASQQTIRLNSEMGQLQDEIRRLNLLLNDGGRSMVGGSSLKANSTLFESETFKREKVLMQIQQSNNKNKQIQLQQKNQNLLLQITKCMKQIKEKEEQNKQLQQKIQVYERNTNQLKMEIDSLKENLEGLNHDYEISLKRKAAFEQQSRQTKLQLNTINDQMVEQQQIYKNIIAQFQYKQKEIIGKVKEIQNSKKLQLQSMQKKLSEEINEKQKLLKLLDDQSNKKGEQLNYKSLLHQQISKLRKQTNMLDRQLQLKEENIYTCKEENLKLANQLKDLQNKTENTKKDLTKQKKFNKQLQKQICQLNKKIENQQNLQHKICSLEHTITLLQSEFLKIKQAYERKSSIHQKILTQMKQRFGVQLAGLLSEDNKQKVKKSNQNKMEIIDKYIEEMVTVSSKTAQIKQLKEEIIELKQHKQIKNISKRTKTSSIEQSTNNLEGNVMSIGTMIMQERLKSQKQTNEARINELNEHLNKEKTMRLILEQQLQKQRVLSAQLKSKQKQQTSNEQISKINKQNQQKIQKLESDLKISRTNNRKLQNDNNELQNQVKKKRQLVVGLKKQYKQLQDRLKQKSAQLSVSTDELQKLKRLQKQVSKKELMFKQFKEKKDQTEEENISLKSKMQNLQDKIKLLHKQISKKDELLKDQRQIQEKQFKIKEQNKIKTANQTIEDQKDIIRKMKCEIQRKDQIIKSTKTKAEARIVELEENGLNREREIQKYKKTIQTNQRKLQQLKISIKREQNKNYLLSVLIKKIFQLCLSQTKQYTTSRITKNRQSTHYYSASSVSPQRLKFSSPANTLKTADLCEGLKILDLRPQDLQGLLGQTTMLGKTNNNIQHETSWSMVSPIVFKQNEAVKQEQLVMGLEELQKLLVQKQLNNASVIQVFKRALRVQ